MKTILITGINGFLGSKLSKHLKSQYNIIGLEYSLKNLFRIKNENFKIYSAEKGITKEIFSEQTIDFIIHTATFYGKCENIKQILNKGIECGCKLFINTDTVLDPFTGTYALTKRQFRDWLYIRQDEIKVINMQLEHFYGPGASPSNFITAMISRLQRNEPVINLTLGEQVRDFTYIDDIVSAYVTILKEVIAINENYTSFQICSGKLISIKQLMEELKRITCSSSRLNFGAISYRENELMKSVSNNSAITALGWKPQINIYEGIKNCVRKI